MYSATRHHLPRHTPWTKVQGGKLKPFLATASANMVAVLGSQSGETAELGQVEYTYCV
jgi:hypothetical protein